MLFTAYVAALGVPLFVLPGYRTTNLIKIFKPSAAASLDDQPLQIHWIVGFAVLVVVYFAFRLLSRDRIDAPPRARLIAGLFLVFLLALIAGLIMAPRALNVVYFIQTTIPLVGFLVGAYLSSSLSGIRTIALTLVSATTISIALVLALALSFGFTTSGWVAGQSLAKTIPQLKDYFPFVVASSLSLALASFWIGLKRTHRALLCVAVVVHLLFYSLTWSRMAFAMLAIVAVSPLLFRERSTSLRTLAAKTGIALVLLVGGAFLISQFSSLANRWQRTGFEVSDSRRAEFAVMAARTVAENPVFGRMFVPDWTHDLSIDRTLRIPRVFKAHNQYLDYGVRAGLPAMILLGWIILAVAQDARLALKSPAQAGLRPMATGVIGALLALLLGNFTQLFLVQAQTGTLAWLLVGMTVRMAEIARSGDGSHSPVDHDG